MKYLVKSDFILTKSALTPVLLPHFAQSDSTKPSYFSSESVNRLPGGTPSFANADVGVQQPYRGRYFRGRVVVLVDGGTFSAASSFTASWRAQRRSTVIGQETGAAEAGCKAVPSRS